MITIRHLQSGEVQRVETLDGVDLAAWEQLDVGEPPAGGGQLVNGQWVPLAKRLHPFQLLNLFTIAERAAGRRLLYVRFPEGHPQAGELVDPAGVVQVLLDSLIAAREPIVLDSSYYVGGVAMLQQFGILTPERAAQVLAGLPPALDP